MLHFVSGLPRSGSTLACNILAQRDDSLVTPTSPLPGILKLLRDQWRGWHMTQPAFDRDASLKRVLQGIAQHYHDPTAEIVFDKSREWPQLIETIEMALERPVKLVCCVRDLPQVAASMEMVWRKNLAAGRIPASLANDPGMLTTHARVQRWLNPADVIGRAISHLNDAYARGFHDRIFLLNFSRLTNHPQEAMIEVERFLGIPPFEYDFSDVQQITVEDDEWHGYSGLHDIRPQVAPVPDRSDQVLGKILARELRQMKYPWEVTDSAAGAHLTPAVV